MNILAGNSAKQRSRETERVERIADHATNITEGVIFMAQAKVIKHHVDTRGEVSKG